MNPKLLSMILLLSLPLACNSPETERITYDLILQGGRVMDPESGLDTLANVAIHDGRIVAISAEELTGDTVLDVSGHVVAPGFIDLHEHGQTEEAYRIMVRDGVTTAFELEVGTGDVDGWYRERSGGRVVNYGVSIGHIPVRMIVMGDSGEFLPSDAAASKRASPEQIAEMARRLEEGLAQGAVAVGFGFAYTPAASTEELETMLNIVAKHNVSAHIHVNSGVAGVKAAIALAKETGASMQVVHANSTGGAETAAFLEAIAAARRSGQDVTTEAYPYEAGMTSIQAAFYDDWESWSDQRIQSHQWVETGERLTRESFGKYRQQGGYLISHARTPAMTLVAIEHPLTMIASDGFIVNGKGHPRTAGSYSKVLGKYVREDGVLSLMEALAKMTIMPAQRLEARVPAMRNKGRIRVGADADITVFDPNTVIDQATYTQSTLPPKGIPYVFVNGVMVVDKGQPVMGAKPGKAVRAPVNAD